jgi:PEP-CTERM motif
MPPRTLFCARRTSFRGNEGKYMRRVLVTALAGAAALGFASAANAGVTLAPVNGGDLATHIDASLDDPANDTTVVFGTTTSPTGADVTFTANTPVHITGGSGFASISDVTSDNQLFTLLTVDPVPNFTAYQFSVAVLTDSYIIVQFLLSGGNPATDWQTVSTGGDPFFQMANQNADYQLTANAGEVITEIRFGTCSTASCANVGGGFKFIKQNSITLASVASVPEPGTWALMLLGFAGLGVALRRGRRGRALAQIA